MNSKQIFLIFLFVNYYFILNAQESTIVTNNSNALKKTFWVGSLPIINQASTYQKLKIEVFGGGYFSDDLATTVFTVSVRGGMIINKEVYGKGYGFNLKVYEVGSQYDFILETTECSDYVSIMVKASSIRSSSNQITHTPLTIKEYSTSGKTNVTSKFTVNHLFIMDNNGNIGINTKTPKNRLDVNGTIRAKEIKIEATDWADFVFEDEYELPALEDIEAHIKENKHLPNIPSAKEVGENGINLGDMNSKLLQKIEELTLYSIQQKKQIDKQESLIQQLNSRLEKLENK